MFLTKRLLIGTLVFLLLLSSCGDSSSQDVGSKKVVGNSKVSTTTTHRESLTRFQAERANLAFNWRRTDYLKRQRRISEQTKRINRSAPKPVHGIHRPASGDVWYNLFGCETGYTYNAQINTGNGYYGAFQFDLTTWESVGGTGYPHEHSYEHQRELAIKLHARRGWSPWPKCSRVLGLR